MRLGALVTAWPFLEEAMADIFRELVGATPNPMPYRHILREIFSAQARIKLMRSLLEKHPLNMAKGDEYDKIIDEFESLNKLRNAYIHGLWSTHESGKIYLSSSEGDQAWFFDNEKEVRLKDIDNMLERMHELKNLAIPMRADTVPNVCKTDRFINRT
jgi:hypothetical protein